MENLKSLVHSILPSSPAFYFALEFPSPMTVVTSIVLPVVFFILSKAVDVLVRIYFERQRKSA